MENYFILLVGLSGSGKSYQSKNLADEYNAEIVSSDNIRKSLYGDESIQQDHNKIFSIVHEMILSHLSNGKNVIFDATNIQRKFRLSILSRIPNRVKRVCYIIATEFSKCIEQNSSRDRVIPAFVIERQRKMFQVPLWSEGWDDIKIIYNFDSSKYFIPHYLNRAKEFNQQNSHHSLTLGGHSLAVMRYLTENFIEDPLLDYAAILHDNGKEYTGTFRNKKGEETQEQHFYEHENVGAYEALFYCKQDDFKTNEALKIATLIEFHMQMYNLQTEKAEQKLKLKVGEDIYKYLKLLNQADKNSH